MLPLLLPPDEGDFKFQKRAEGGEDAHLRTLESFIRSLQLAKCLGDRLLAELAEVLAFILGTLLFCACLLLFFEALKLCQLLFGDFHHLVFLLFHLIV